MGNSKSPAKLDRAQIIRAVQTPLGFFVLTVLVIEAIFGVLASTSTAPERGYVIGGMFTILLILIAVVTFLAYQRPEALAGTRPLQLPLSPAPHPPASSLERIPRPRVLIASTPDFEALGFERDTKAIERGLSVRPVIAHVTSSSDLRKRLTEGTYDVLHLLGYVETESGDLIVTDKQDRISADALATLATVSRARLVVLASCDSLTLGARLSRNVNVIAGLGWIEVDTAVAWAECFYLMLGRGEPLATAFELARDSTDCPMLLLLRNNVVFAPP